MRMLKFKCYFLLFIYAFGMHYRTAIAADQSLGVGICYINENQNNCQFRPPSVVATATNINSMVFTFNNMDVPIGNNAGGNQQNWGVHFSTGAANNNFYCSQSSCSSSSGDSVKVDANNQFVQIVQGTPDNTINHAVGTLVITISNFASGQIPSQLQQLLTSATDAGVTVQAFYLSEDQSTNPQSGSSTDPTVKPSLAGESLPYTWTSDLGTLLNPPKVSGLARFNGFAITIAPPDDLSAVKQSPVGSSPTDLVTNPEGNHVTGYLIALWLAHGLNGESPCDSNWLFDVNPISYSTNKVNIIPTLSCTPLYSPSNPYNEAVDGTGGKTNDLQCTSIPPIISPTSPSTSPYLSSTAITLTPNNVAVPTFSGASKKDWLQNLLNNPSQLQATTNACYQVVYVPVSHTSFSKQGIEKGEVYGYTAWALNAAYTTDDPTPNISLAHSNIGYITGTDADLASLAKDPNLKLKTADCFIATAASNDINSKSVFYWRVLRDEYLTRWGFTPYYYKYAPTYAHWLDENPQYKPAVNFVLEKTGGFFYFTSLYTKKFVKTVSNLFSKIFVQEASAFELSKPQEYNTNAWYNAPDNDANTASNEPQNDSHAWFNAPQNEDTIASNEDEDGPHTWFNDPDSDDDRLLTENDNNKNPLTTETEDEYASSEPLDAYNKDTEEYNKDVDATYEKQYVAFEKNINFDFALSGGVLFPTSDHKLYKKYYKHLTFDYELSSSAIFWLSNFAWSIGAKLNYGYNSQKSEQIILGTDTQSNVRNLYLSSLELISGLRYRNINFLYVQPNIFAGAGILRLREESKAEADPGTNGAGDKNEILGVTNFSAVFDFGANVDISLATIFMYSERELALEHDILLRLTAIYRINPSKALSASGLILNAGFAFLL